MESRILNTAGYGDSVVRTMRRWSMWHAVISTINGNPEAAASSPAKSAIHNILAKTHD